MNALSIKVFGVLGFILVTLWCLHSTLDRIPAGISRRVSAVLQAGRIQLDSITVSGRDVYFTGAAPESLGAAKALRLAKSVPGVRRVVANVRVIPPVEKKPAVVQQSLNDLLAEQQITFTLRSDELSGESYALLDRIAALLQRYPGYHIEIRGHTDSLGVESFNIRLSQRRAEAVKKYLIRKGIAEKRLSVKGYGSSKPIAPNTDKQGREKNRRVEFFVREEQ